VAKPKSVKALVEEHSAAVRKLARTLRRRIESSAYGDPDRKIIEGCAAMLDAVAEGMIERVNHGDKAGLYRFWKMSTKVALMVGGSAGFLSGVGQGIGTAAFDYFTDDEDVSACVIEIVSTADEHEQVIIDWQEPSTHRGRASLVVGPVTGAAKGGVNPGGEVAHDSSAPDDARLAEDSNSIAVEVRATLGSSGHVVATAASDEAGGFVAPLIAPLTARGGVPAEPAPQDWQGSIGQAHVQPVTGEFRLADPEPES